MNDTALMGAGARAGTEPRVRTPASSNESGPSAVSWAAIFAGAAGAAALSLILLILGTGLGLSSQGLRGSQK